MADQPADAARVDPTVGGGRVGFAVERDGTAHPLDVSAGLSAAYDILTDDGYPAEKAASLLAAAERDGRDPEAFARKMVRLRGALQ